jgi:hypothetical protein
MTREDMRSLLIGATVAAAAMAALPHLVRILAAVALAVGFTY